MTAPRKPGRPSLGGRAKRDQRAAQVRLTPALASALEQARAVVDARHPERAPASDAAVLEVALLDLAGRPTLEEALLEIAALRGEPAGATGPGWRAHNHDGDDGHIYWERLAGDVRLYVAQSVSWHAPSVVTWRIQRPYGVTVTEGQASSCREAMRAADSVSTYAAGLDVALLDLARQ
jgi:hypothetical protein